MYTVAVTRDFIANHKLVGGDWGVENLPHAHRYVAEVSIESTRLDQHGYLVDITEIEAALVSIVDYFRDCMLNDKPEFAGLNPSIEHFSRIIAEKMLPLVHLPETGALTVRLWENATCWASFRQEF